MLLLEAEAFETPLWILLLSTNENWKGEYQKHYYIASNWICL